MRRRILVKMEEDFIKQIEEEAKKQDRSRNKQIVYMCKTYFALTKTEREK